MGDFKENIILKEWELLQNIINGQENIIFKIRSWQYTLLTGLTFMFYSKDVDLSHIMYIIIGCILVIVFYFIEIPQRAVHKLAIKRVREVENCIFQSEYSGPKISESLKSAEDLKYFLANCKQHIFNATILVPKLLVIVVVLILAFTAP